MIPSIDRRGVLALLSALAACRGDAGPIDDTGFPTEFEVCEEVRQDATFRPVTLLLAVDQSASMDEGSPRKWDAVTAAMTAFVTDPGASRLDVAVRLWPADACNAEDCDPDGCAQPTVDVGPLSDESHREAIIVAFEGVEPRGDTPLSAALEGSGQWAVARREVEPLGTTAVALVTDGTPVGCVDDIDAITTIASGIAADGVPTFLVGIAGSNEAQLDRIAVAAGTAQAYFVGEADVEASLLRALQDIQGRILPCTLPLPEGRQLDLDLVRLEVTETGTTTILPRRVDADACDPEGWYLEGDEAVLCPATCKRLQALPDVTVEAAVGCACLVDEDCGADEACRDNLCVPCDTVEACGPGPNVQGGARTCATGPAPVAGGLGLLVLVLASWSRRRSS